MNVENPNQSKSALVVIFITVFIYLVGFGIIIPILPLLSREYGATSTETGLLMSIYSLMQFLFAPFWGRLSDRYGRRPILLFCLFCEIFCYLLLAFSNSLTLLFIARGLAGFFGASLSTASAYISDVTSKQDRSKGMALIGVAFGLGFLLGPALGGGLSILGQKVNLSMPQLTMNFEHAMPALFVALLCICNLLFAFKALKETKVKDLTSTEHKEKRWNLLFHYLRQPTLGWLIFIFFLVSFAMSSMEATFILYMNDVFHWTTRDVSFGFAYIGLVMVLTQGYFVRKILPRWGERKTLALGVLLFAIGLTSIGIATTLFEMILSVTCLSIGNGLTNPATLGSISLLATNEEQGASMGVTQSLSSLGRILGPAVGGFVYGHISKNSSFFFSGILAFTGFLLIMMIFQKIPEHAKIQQT